MPKIKDNCQHFLVINRIVALCRAELLREVGDRSELSFLIYLRETYTNAVPRAVSFQDRQEIRVPIGQNGSGYKPLL